MPNSLQHLILRKGRGSALRTTLAIQLGMLAIFLVAAGALHTAHLNSLMNSASQALDRHLLDATLEVDRTLLQVEFWAEALQRESTAFYTGIHEHASDDWQARRTDYGFAGNGVFYRLNSGDHGHLYYTAAAAIGEAEARKAIESERLDPLLKSIVTSQPTVSAAYLNSVDGMNRYYPFIDNIHEIFPAEQDIRDHVFFSVADEINNPERELKWTEPYLDPASGGWMISCSAPVYYGDRLEAVIGLDLTLVDLAEHLLSLDLPWPSHSILLAGDDSIVAYSDRLGVALGLKSLGAASGKGGDATVTSARGIPLEECSGGLAEAMQGREPEEHSRIELGGRPYLMAGSGLAEGRFTLLTLTDMESLFEPVQLLTRQAILIGLLALTCLLLLDIALYIGLTRHSRSLAREISTPLNRLMLAVSRFREHQERTVLPESGIREFDGLRDNFLDMCDTVHEARTGITRLNQSYSRFVPQTFLQFLGRKSVLELQAGDHVTRPLVLLQACMHGCNPDGGPCDSSQAFECISEWVGKLGPQLGGHGGFIQSYAGDSLLALFDDADAALEAALNLFDHLGVLNSERAGRRMSPLRMGIGLHHGPVMIGVVGDRDRIDVTVIGQIVNDVGVLGRLATFDQNSILLSEQFKSALARPEAHELFAVPSSESMQKANLPPVHSLPSPRRPVATTPTTGQPPTGKVLP